MIIIKKNIKLISIPIISLLTIPVIFTIFNLFNISIHPAIYLLSIILISFITGIITGIIKKEKGLLNGLIIGTSITMVFILLSIIFKSKITLYNIIYYLIIILTTTLGSIIAVNKKES